MEYFNKMSAQVEAHGLRLYSVFVGTEACVWQGDDAAGREAEGAARARRSTSLTR